MKINSLKFFFVILIFLFLLPIFLYGSFDKEEFSYSFVATQIVNDSFNNFFFKTFSDQFAFGVNFPFGTGVYYLPSIVSSKIAYLISPMIICLLIQYYFLTKILSIIKINKSFFIIIILIFSPANIRYAYYHDWVSHLFLYSLSFGIIYYLIKIFCKKNIELSYLKILFLLAIIALNSHIGHSTVYFLIFLIFSMLNFDFRELLKLKYLFYTSFLLIVVFYKFYTLLDVFEHTKDGSRLRLGKYNFYDVISGLVNPLYTISKILNILTLNLSLDNPLTNNFYLHLKDLIDKQSGHNQRLHMFNGVFEYFVIYLFISNLKKIKNLRKNSFYIFDIIILCIILTFIPLNFIPTFISSTLYLPELIYIFSILSFLKLNTFYKKNIFHKIIKIIIILCLVLNYVEGINLIKNSNNYYTHKYGNFFSNINLNINNLNRIYLSPKIYKDIEVQKNKDNNFFLSQGIYDTKELYNFNFHPININIKNSHGSIQSKTLNQMQWEFYPSYDEIQSDIFFDLFNIKFLLIYENEVKDIKQTYDSFKIIKHTSYNDNKILLLQKNKNKHAFLFDMDEKNTCNKLVSLLDCVESKKNKFSFREFSDINLIRVNDSRYVIKNNSEIKINYIFPFINDNNWYINGKLYIRNNFFVSAEIKPNSTITIEHKNNTFSYIKISSFIFLFILILIIIFKSYNKNYYNKKLKSF